MTDEIFVNLSNFLIKSSTFYYIHILEFYETTFTGDNTSCYYSTS